MKSFDIAGRPFGEGAPVLIAAEVGINHNGELALAHRAIDAAADAGADAVKFQNYRTEDFVTDRSLAYEYENAGRKVRELQYDMFKRCEMKPGWLAELNEHCRRRKLVFFSTPTGEDGVRELKEVGAPLLKNGSDYLANLPLIRAMARTGLPTVLSTGMATLADIEDAVDAFRGAGGAKLVLLHCTSAYPTPDEDVNLRRIPVLQATFQLPIGFSDHSSGTTAAAGAAALGACFIEKHFTLDKSLPGPDHRFSSDPAEFAALVAGVRALERQLGSRHLGPAASEVEARKAYRLSCAAARDLAAGSALSAGDVVFVRPGSGLPPKAVETILGRKLAAGVKQGHIFRMSDFHG